MVYYVLLTSYEYYFGLPKHILYLCFASGLFHRNFHPLQIVTILIADKSLLKSTSESGTEWENESSGDGEDEFVGFEKEWSESESCYSSDSSAESSLPDSPVPEDTNSKLYLM